MHMLIKFIYHLISRIPERYAVEYNNFKQIQQVKQKIQKQRQEAHDHYVRWCKYYGFERFRTLSEIAKDNQEFEESNPEQFPGLFKNN